MRAAGMASGVSRGAGAMRTTGTAGAGGISLAGRLPVRMSAVVVCSRPCASSM